MSQQLIFIPIVGISQLIFISNISRRLENEEYSQTLLIINLSSIVTFLDFGLLYSYFYFASTNYENSYNMNQINRKFAILTIKLVALEISIAILLICLDFYKTIGLYLLIFALNIPGLMNLTQLRTRNMHLTFLSIFNLSWPLSVGFLIYFETLHPLHLTRNIGYLPIATSALINSIYLVATWKKSLFSKILTKNDGGIGRKMPLASFIPGVFINSTLFAIVTQCDKYFASVITSGRELSLFLTYSQISTSILGILNLAYLNSKLTQNQYKRFSMKLSLYPGALAGLLFISVSAIFINLFFHDLYNSKILLLLGSINLLLYGILLSVNAQITARGNPNYRFPGLLSQVMVIISCYFIGSSNISIVSLQFVIALSIGINIAVGLFLLHSKFLENTIQ